MNNTPNQKNILLLATESDSANIVYNYLSDRIDLDHVLFEEYISRTTFLKKRVKKLGLLKVIGQIIFIISIPKVLKYLSKKRIQQIVLENNLRTTPPPKKCIQKFTSINSNDSIEAIKKISPTLIIVKGTRIISQKVLDSVSCPIVNIHAGITPYYRGVHGAYWSLANQEKEKCGVTVHLVDKGIDTGNILKQDVIDPSNKDNYITYPYLQLSKGLELLDSMLEGLLSENYNTIKKEEKGKLWHHPTLWQYIKNRIVLGVK